MKVLNVAWRTLRVALFDKKNLLIMFLMPLAFSLVFGLLLNPGGGGSSNLPLAVLVTDEHPITTIVVERLQANPRLVTKVVTTEAALQAEIGASQVVAGLVLPSGFGELVKAGEAATATLLREVDTNLFIAVEQELRSMFTQLASASVTANQLQGTTAAGDQWLDVFQRSLAAWDDPALGIESIPIGSSEPAINDGTHIGIAFTIMFVMMAISMAAGCVLEEREWGTWSRLVAAPIEKGQLMAGYVLGYFGLGWFQLGILMFLQKLIFKAEFGGGWGLVVLASALILCAVSVGMLMAVTVKTFQQQQAVAAIVLNVTSMLGGLFFPVEMFTPALAKIAMLTPQFWARQGFVELVLRGSSWAALQKPLFILAAYSVVFFLIGWQRLRTSE